MPMVNLNRLNTQKFNSIDRIKYPAWNGWGFILKYNSIFSYIDKHKIIELICVLEDNLKLIIELKELLEKQNINIQKGN